MEAQGIFSLFSVEFAYLLNLDREPQRGRSDPTQPNTLPKPVAGNGSVTGDSTMGREGDNYALSPLPLGLTHARSRAKRAPANSSPRGRGAVPADLDVLWCLARAIETPRPPQQCVDD